MTNFVRLSVMVDQDTAIAARTLRALLEAPGGADMRAGGSLSADTLERIHVATANLAARTSGLMTKAMGLDQKKRMCLYTFELLNAADDVVGGAQIIWVEDDAPGARRMMIEEALTDKARTFDPEIHRVSLKPVSVVPITAADAVVVE